MNSSRSAGGRGWAIFRMTAILFLFSCSSVRYLGSGDKPAVYRPHYMSKLSEEIPETSGLEYLDGLLWTFNDSGGKPVLYAFPPRYPKDLRIFSVSGAVNTDWEDITRDEDSFYISDAGNNFGTRDTLTIYKVVADTQDDLAPAVSVISFSYPSKTKEFKGYKANPYDSEAIIYHDDSLWVFTKNWQDESSCIYVYPDRAGYYRFPPRFCLETGMLVTAADLDERSGMLWLLGYHHYVPEIQVYRAGEDRPPVEVLQIRMKNRAGLQTEGIVCAPDGYVYISFERSKRHQGLLRMKNPF